MTDVEVLIIGAGFGGVYLCKLLRDEGFKVKVVEAGDQLGGIWNWNRYPGARVDCEMPYYGYSDPAIWKDWEYTQRYPDDAELRRYFKHVDSVWNVSKDVSFNTRVTGARYLPDSSSWDVTMADGSSCKARFVAACTGTSFKQYVPDWPSINTFKGKMSHSSLWPAQGIDMTNKRVAVIGSGCTGVQILQEAAKVASHVTQFSRSPAMALPMRQRSVTPAERDSYKAYFPAIFESCRNSFAAFPFSTTRGKCFDATPEERERHWEDTWTRGGFHIMLDQYIDCLTDPKANRELYDFWAKKTRARITNPQKRDILAPLDPPFFFSTKRPSLEQDYFEMADQDNVALVTTPIQSFAETGIKTSDGELHKFDVVAIATGYDAVTGGLATMGIKGVDGLDLHDKWADGVATHLGLMAHGFPNLFMVYGPQAPTSFTNGPPFIEMQCEWIRDAVVGLRDQKLGRLEPKPEAERAWRQQVLAIAQHTLYVQTSSWYMGANVPGKRREMLMYAGGVAQYGQEIKGALDGWRDFDVA